MKKRANQAIMFVIIIGFVVTLAALVVSWYTTYTEDITDSAIELVDAHIECDKVRINVKDENVDGDCSALNISNKGYLIINKIITRSPNTNKIEIIPVIKQKETKKEIGCKEKSIVLDCFLTESIVTETEIVDLSPDEWTDSLLNPYP